MGDLISRSAAMENYCNALCPKPEKGEYCEKCIVASWMNNQPTAYDVDAVEQEMEKYKTAVYSELLEEEVAVINLDRAKVIVRAGGKEY